MTGGPIKTVTKEQGIALAIVILLMVTFIFLIGFFGSSWRGWNWFLIIVFMTSFLALIGKLITTQWWGIFINERNKISLSRFQLVIWTLIVLSAFLTIALGRIHEIFVNPSLTIDPLAIEIPRELWALLGISTASFVGSPLILSTKPPANLSIRSVAEKPNLADMFRGDETANENSIDMAKVQMFFFTLIIAFSYMILILNLIMTKTPDQLDSFPQLTQGLVALLGISSAGYLTSKAVPKKEQT
jgi:hypothetical protein